MNRPFLSATLICRDEKANIRRCLDSLWDHVDEVCIADTGSVDGTLGEALDYAKSRRQADKLKTRVFLDCNDEDGHIRDFAMARNAADAMATGEWVVWADIDDTIVGLDRLREMAATADPNVLAFFARYRYAADPDGNPISELWRERVVRNNGMKWVGRLHEHKFFEARADQLLKVGPDVAEWLHHRDHNIRTGDRNLRILEDWDRDEPNNPRIIHSLGMEYMGAERHEDAVDAFSRYLAIPGEAPDRRAQATRQLCVNLMILGRAQEARQAALTSFAEFPMWPDTHLTLAEASQTLGDPQAGIMHAQTALHIGKPDTLLIVNPLHYTAHPHALMAVCLAQMGRIDEAVQEAQEALKIAPSYQLVERNMPLWHGQLRKQNAIGAFLACAQVLTEAGELEKARALLDQVPWYVTDEQRIIGKRAETSRLIAQRLAALKVAVDEAADKFVERWQEAA